MPTQAWGRTYVTASGSSFLLDTLSATSISAVSSRKLRSGFLGNPCIVARGDGAHSTHTCLFTAGGDLDITDLQTFAAGHDCGVSTWFDQSPSANDMVAASVPGAAISASPQLVNAGTCFTQNGRACPQFIRTATGTDAFFNNSQTGNTGTAITQPFSIAVAFAFFNTGSTNGIANNVNGNVVSIGAGTGAYSINAGLFNSGGTIDTSFHTAIAIFNGANSFLYIDGTAIIGPVNAGANSYYGTSAFNCVGTNNSFANIAEYLVFPVDLSASGTDMSKIHTNWQSYWGSL